MSEIIDPFEESGGTGVSAPVITELSDALGRLYASQSRYARHLQVQAPAGDFFIASRLLPPTASEYPPVASPLFAQFGEAVPVNDPYVYGVAHYQRAGQDKYTMLRLSTFLLSLRMAVGGYCMATPEGDIVEGIDDHHTIINEAALMLDGLREGVSNAAPLAHEFSWSQIRGDEAVRYQHVFERLLTAKGIDPREITKAVGLELYEVVEGPWGLDRLVAAPVQAPDSRIPGVQMNVYACTADDRLIGSTAIYQPHTQGSQYDDLMVSFGKFPRGLVILTPTQRQAALAALELQLQPDNVYLVQEENEG